VTDKAGDSAPIWLSLSTLGGQALQFNTYAAFLAAGYSILFFNGSSPSSVQPTIQNWSPLKNAAGQSGGQLKGRHSFTISLQYGFTMCLVLDPVGCYHDPDNQIMITPATDEDALAALLLTNMGTPQLAQASGSQSVVNFQFPMSTSVQAQFTVPAAGLTLLDTSGSIIYTFPNMTAIGGQPWRITSSCRYQDSQGPLPFNPVAFSFTTDLLNATLNQIGIGWATPPAGAQIDSYGATATCVQLGGQVQNTAVVTNGGVYYNTAPTVTIGDGGSGTGATASCTVANGSVVSVQILTPGSGYTSPTITFGQVGDQNVPSRAFNYDIKLQPPTGSTYQSYILRPFAGVFTLTRNQT
jgi:hypothetical protein